MYVEDNLDTAYGLCIDAIKDQKVAELCRAFNDRSIKHAKFSEEERKQDDFDTAMNSILVDKENKEEIERSKYVRHYVEY